MNKFIVFAALVWGASPWLLAAGAPVLPVVPYYLNAQGTPIPWPTPLPYPTEDLTSVKPVSITNQNTPIPYPTLANSYGASIVNWLFNVSPTPQYPVSVINSITVANLTPQVVPTTYLVSASSALPVSLTGGIGTSITNWMFNSSPTPQYPVSVINLPSVQAVSITGGTGVSITNNSAILAIATNGVLIINTNTFTPTPTPTPTITATPVNSFTPTLTPTATFTPTFQSVVVVSGDVYSPVTVNLNHNTNGMELMMTESVNIVASGGATIWIVPMPVGQSNNSGNYAAIVFAGGTANTPFQDFIMPTSYIRSFNKFIIRPQVTATQTVVVTYIINLNIPGPFSFNPAIESQRHAWNNYVPWWKVILG